MKSAGRLRFVVPAVVSAISCFVFVVLATRIFILKESRCKMFTDPLRKTLGFTGKFGAHIIPWNSALSNKTHYNPNTAYSYDNPATIGKVLDVLQASGIDVCFFTYQGPFIGPQHSVVVEFVAQLAKRGMLFALVMDQWSAGGTTNVSLATQNLIKGMTAPAVREMLASPAYIPEKAILDFGTNADWAKIGLKNPIWYRHQHYSWVEVAPPSGIAPVDPIVVLKKDNANSTMKVPGLSIQFFDGGMPSTFLVAPDGIDWNQSSWQLPSTPQKSGTARYVSARAGNFFFDQVAVTPKNVPYIAFVTLDDFHEGTNWLTYLSIAANIRVS